jgi:hypothetical protein
MAAIGPPRRMLVPRRTGRGANGANGATAQEAPS